MIFLKSRLFGFWAIRQRMAGLALVRICKMALVLAIPDWAMVDKGTLQKKGAGRFERHFAIASSGFAKQDKTAPHFIRKGKEIPVRIFPLP